MKKLLCLLIALVMLSLGLTGCGAAAPEVREGEFDVSVAYEVNGEAKSLDLVYICEYDGVDMTVEGTRYRAWKGHFDGYEDGEVIEVLDTEDGGRIVLSFLIYPEYFMGEPDYTEDFHPCVLVNYVYYEDGVEMIEDDQEHIADAYGVKIIGCEYDAPIENVFGRSN